MVNLRLAGLPSLGLTFPRAQAEGHETVSASLGCCNKEPRGTGLKQPVPSLAVLEERSPQSSMGRAPSRGSRGGLSPSLPAPGGPGAAWLAAASRSLCLHCHMAFSLCICLPLLTRTPVIVGLGPTPLQCDLILTNSTCSHPVPK